MTNADTSRLKNRVLAVLELREAEQIRFGLYDTQTRAEHISSEWTKETGRAAVAVNFPPSITEDEALDSLRQLADDGSVIEWRPGHFRSRVAETVRVMRLLRQRFWNQRSLAEAALLVEDIRVEFRERRRPRRAAVPLTSAIPAAAAAEVAASFRQAFDPPFSTLSGFQSRALQSIYECAREGNRANESFIIAGDTGAGKTEAFLFPILLDIAGESAQHRGRVGVRAVLVYPRIRLARNQLGRILRYTKIFRSAGAPRITTGVQNGDVPANLKAIDERWESTERGDKKFYRVELLETCVDCRAGRYLLAADDPETERGCPRLFCEACDEEIDTLHVTQRALERCAPDLLIITDVSLSQWLAREKYSHLWGLWDGEVVTEPPRFLVLDEVHLYERIKGAHIARLIKRFQARVRLTYRGRGEGERHPVIVGVSATLHDERQFLAKLLDVDPLDSNQAGRLRVIKPAEDELEPTDGRERYVFIYPRRISPTTINPLNRVTDQTAAIQTVMVAMHNLKPRGQEWRGVAFFDSINDLRQFYYNFDGGPGAQARTRFTGFTPANLEELWRIRTDRRKAGAAVPNRCGGTCEDRARDATLHECPHFQAGDCWVFARLHGLNQRLRIAAPVFAGAADASALDTQDLIPTSPSLEVGYDDDAIQLVYQHKAPPNAASFIQRRGRAGRDPNDSPVVITLLWPYRRDDAFYFFHPEALYDPAFDDAPLNASNFNVQRTHTLLAFFDLLACLRRQNLDGVRDDPRVIDFTRAGVEYVTPGPENVRQFKKIPDPKNPGREKLIIDTARPGERVWLSGRQLEYVRDDGGNLALAGWLAMDKGLTFQALRPAFERLRGILPSYLALSEIAAPTFVAHHTYPFRISAAESLPTRLLSTFGDKVWHSSEDQVEWWNWLKTYRLIDWMLQGSDEATTLTVHYPNPGYRAAAQNNRAPGAELPENTIDVTFALTEFLPGNVSFRLRETNWVHWTPIPRDGESTFLFPEQDILDEQGNVVGRGPIAEFLPRRGEITAKRDSIFGVPRHLDRQFPGLPFITLRRLFVREFGRSSEQYASRWYFDTREQRAVELAANAPPPATGVLIGRRTTTSADSVVIPFIAAEREVARKQLLPPLLNLFRSVDGFLEEGRGALGYTRVFYEMQISVNANRKELERKRLDPGSLTLRRCFYDHENRPTLVGYTIETQGIRFQLNSDLLSRVVEAILGDEGLRLRLRRNFTAYHMSGLAVEWGVFPKQFLEYVAAAVDYWLHVVVPSSRTEPRMLDPSTDLLPLRDFFRNNRVVRAEEVNLFETFLNNRPDFFERLNDALGHTFRESEGFRDFVVSVLLHSLSSLLKNLVARLGGVGSDDLVAYADLPVLDKVDRTSEPRILIMDTIQGGSGGIAQAFSRIDLSEDEGALWWMLQTELGSCPIGNGEGLVRAVLTQATSAQVEAVQQADAEAAIAALDRMLEELGLDRAAPEAKQALGRVVFNRTEVDGAEINAALIIRELFALQRQIEAEGPGPVPRQAAVRRATAMLAGDTASPQLVFAGRMRQSLMTSGVARGELDYELAQQLLAIYHSACEDGCPVCLSADSDIEHYSVAHLLNSRLTLKKLRDVLFQGLESARGSCLAAVADALLQKRPEHESVFVANDPGSLGNRVDRSLGLAVASHVDEDGQVRSASAVVVDARNAEESLRETTGLEEQWGGAADHKYRVQDGTEVLSQGEYIIATWLWSNDIAYDYKFPLAYRDEQGRVKRIHPDFYLLDHRVYVEFWGRNDPEYVESREFKEGAYRRANVEPIVIEEEEVSDGSFMRKIGVRLGLPDDAGGGAT